MVQVSFLSSTGKPLEAFPIGFEPFDESSGSDPFRVRHLIEKLVNECVRDFNFRENDRVFGILTQGKIDQGLAKGKIGSPREEKQEVNLDIAVGQALQAFEDRLYLLFVDKNEKKDLDEIVRLQPDTEITVIRLTALAGY